MTSFLETLTSYKCIGNEDSKIYAGGWGGGGVEGYGGVGGGGQKQVLNRISKRNLEISMGSRLQQIIFQAP